MAGMDGMRSAERQCESVQCVPQSICCADFSSGGTSGGGSGSGGGCDKGAIIGRAEVYEGRNPHTCRSYSSIG